MSTKRRQHNPEFKAKVALEALMGIEPVHAISAKYQVHTVQMSQWKKDFLERLPGVFATNPTPSAAQAAAKEYRLYRKSGRSRWNSIGLKTVRVTQLLRGET
jgi:transposase-like protein